MVRTAVPARKKPRRDPLAPALARNWTKERGVTTPLTCTSPGRCPELLQCAPDLCHLGNRGAAGTLDCSEWPVPPGDVRDSC
ncbi:hypothetical protein NDU88_008414 [Pleurodeles waltl]|uniref:Uncharacterized protein n=1 Tax=Pleurodeles waltl TaxID=8319 RepID=A0AAV7SVV2_PLEWA|nr:hypothetical protein NDU88_008414 [Pleurodeles waltl]